MPCRKRASALATTETDTVVGDALDQNAWVCTEQAAAGSSSAGASSSAATAADTNVSALQDLADDDVRILLLAK